MLVRLRLQRCNISRVPSYQVMPPAKTFGVSGISEGIEAVGVDNKMLSHEDIGPRKMSNRR